MPRPTSFAFPACANYLSNPGVLPFLAPRVFAPWPKELSQRNLHSKSQSPRQQRRLKKPRPRASVILGQSEKLAAALGESGNNDGDKFGEYALSHEQPTDNPLDGTRSHEQSGDFQSHSRLEADGRRSSMRSENPTAFVSVADSSADNGLDHETELERRYHELWGSIEDKPGTTGKVLDMKILRKAALKRNTTWRSAVNDAGFRKLPPVSAYLRLRLRGKRRRMMGPNSLRERHASRMAGWEKQKRLRRIEELLSPQKTLFRSIRDTKWHRPSHFRVKTLFRSIRDTKWHRPSHFRVKGKSDYLTFKHAFRRYNLPSDLHKNPETPGLESMATITQVDGAPRQNECKRCKELFSSRKKLHEHAKECIRPHIHRKLERELMAVDPQIHKSKYRSFLLSDIHKKPETPGSKSTAFNSHTPIYAARRIKINPSNSFLLSDIHKKPETPIPKSITFDNFRRPTAFNSHTPIYAHRRIKINPSLTSPRRHFSSNNKLHEHLKPIKCHSELEREDNTKTSDRKKNPETPILKSITFDKFRRPTASNSDTPISAHRRIKIKRSNSFLLSDIHKNPETLPLQSMAADAQIHGPRYRYIPIQYEKSDHSEQRRQMGEKDYVDLLSRRRGYRWVKPDLKIGSVSPELCLSAHSLDEKLYEELKSQDGPQISQLYDGIEATNTPIQFYTHLQFIHELARKGETRTALKALRNLHQQGHALTEPRMMQQCATLLQNRFRKEDTPPTDFEIFEWMVTLGLQPNAIIYNILIFNSTKRGDRESAYQIFEEMKQNGVEPDSSTYSILLNDARLHGDMDSVRGIFQVVSEKHAINANIATDLLYCIYLLQRESNMETGSKLPAFKPMFDFYRQHFPVRDVLNLIPPDYREPGMEDESVYIARKKQLLAHQSCLFLMLTVMIRNLNTPQEVLDFYTQFQMLVEKEDPTIRQFVNIHEIYDIFLMAFGRYEVTLGMCAEVLQNMLSPPAYVRSLPPSVKTWSILLKAFMKHQQPRAAEKVLKMMRDRGLEPVKVTWHDLIQGYAVLQDIQGALDAQDRMEEAGWVADAETEMSLNWIKDREALTRMRLARNERLGLEDHAEPEHRGDFDAEDEDWDGHKPEVRNVRISLPRKSLEDDAEREYEDNSEAEKEGRDGHRPNEPVVEEVGEAQLGQAQEGG